MSRGHLMFAHNNEEIDYTLIALCNALMIKANLKEKEVALITDKWSHDWLIEHHGESLVNKAFDQIIHTELPAVTSRQPRNFHDTYSTKKELTWNNHGRASAYELSPFEETVVLDADYLVMDSSLDHVWGGSADFMINRAALTLEHKLPHGDEIHVEPFGIPMYWATCFYFKKNEVAELVFKMVEHVRDNYEYYQMLYRLPGRLYRNDYAFSIAIHALSGCLPDGVEALPNPTIFTSFDRDELIDVPGKNELIFLVNDDEQSWRFRASRVQGTNVHVMNKFSITRMAPKLIEVYG